VLADEYGDKLLAMSEAEWLPVVRSEAIEMMLEEIKAISPRSTSGMTCFFRSGR